MRSSEPIGLERRGASLVLTIERPDRRNALGREANQAMAEALDMFAEDPALRVAIITGTGDQMFCSGFDLADVGPDGDPGFPPSGFGGLTSRFGLDKPVIAAVNGLAVGGGFELALACDIIVAATHAAFALPEALVGLAPIAGGMQRLPKIIGIHRALAMMLAGQRMTAGEALDAGLVSEIVAPGAALDCALRWADAILRCGPLAVKAIKETVHAGADLPVAEAIAVQSRSPSVRRMLGSQDAVEGPAAFLAKRAPNWLGR